MNDHCTQCWCTLHSLLFLWLQYIYEFAFQADVLQKQAVQLRVVNIMACPWVQRRKSSDLQKFCNLQGTPDATMLLQLKSNNVRSSFVPIPLTNMHGLPFLRNVRENCSPVLCFGAFLWPSTTFIFPNVITLFPAVTKWASAHQEKLKQKGKTPII